ncbi:ATP-binding protein [Sagittula marina]|nr:ATP-binding protein [Sagittula marina]
MSAELVQLGYDSSYERVAAFVRVWKDGRQRPQHTTDRGTFVPLVVHPDKAFQFVWSEAEDTKMTTALLEPLTHRCHILETGYDSYRLKISSETAKNRRRQWH